MDLPEIRVRAGASYPLFFDVDDETAQSVSIIVRTAVDGTVLLVKNKPFVNLEADLSLTIDETDIPEGEYIYQYTVFYEDNADEKYPDPENHNCEGECSFPTFVVCPSLDPGVS